jgi:iron complex transport system substrate-binding protein
VIRRSSILALLLLVAGILVGCEDRPQPATTSTPSAIATPTAVPPVYPRTLTDASKQELTLEAQPQRIVSMSPGATETLFAIGAGPRVIAVDQFSDFPPDATRALTRVDYSRPNPEQVIALRPDLVLMSGRQRDQVQRFRDLGVPVLYIGDPATLDAVFEHMLLIGSATGHDDGAAQVVRSLRARVAAVQVRIEGVTTGPLVFYELSPSLHTAGPNSFIGSVITTLKGRNIATTRTPFPQLSNEALIAADPEVVLLAGSRTAKVDPGSVAARPGWDGISAVRNDRVHVLDGDVASRPGPRIVDALETIARLFYPDRFR